MQKRIISLLVVVSIFIFGCAPKEQIPRHYPRAAGSGIHRMRAATLLGASRALYPPARTEAT